eukprot:gene1480-1703_t
MVKTAAKTVILKVLELDDPLVDKYAITPSITSFLAATLADDLGRLFTSLLNNVVDIYTSVSVGLVEQDSVEVIVETQAQSPSVAQTLDSDLITATDQSRGIIDGVVPPSLLPNISLGIDEARASTQTKSTPILSKSTESASPSPSVTGGGHESEAARMNRRRRLEISAEGVAADWARLEDCLYFLQDLLMRGRGARGAPGGDRVELRDRVAQGIVLPFLYGSVLDTLAIGEQGSRRASPTAARRRSGAGGQLRTEDEVAPESPSGCSGMGAESFDTAPHEVTALAVLIKMLRVVRSSLFRRALLVALFHPLSRKTRKRALSERLVVGSSRTAVVIDVPGVPSALCAGRSRMDSGGDGEAMGGLSRRRLTCYTDTDGDGNVYRRAFRSILMGGEIGPLPPQLASRLPLVCTLLSDVAIDDDPDVQDLTLTAFQELQDTLSLLCAVHVWPCESERSIDGEMVEIQECNGCPDDTRAAYESEIDLIALDPDLVDNQKLRWIEQWWARHGRTVDDPDASVVPQVQRSSRVLIFDLVGLLTSWLAELVGPAIFREVCWALVTHIHAAVKFGYFDLYRERESPFSCVVDRVKVLERDAANVILRLMAEADQDFKYGIPNAFVSASEELQRLMSRANDRTRSLLQQRLQTVSEAGCIPPCNCLESVLDASKWVPACSEKKLGRKDDSIDMSGRKCIVCCKLFAVPSDMKIIQRRPANTSSVPAAVGGGDGLGGRGGNKSKPSVLSTAIRSSASSNTILNGEVSAPSRHPSVSSTSTPPKLRKASLWETLRRPLTSPKSASEIEDKGTDVFLILETDELLIVRQELHLADMGVTPPSRRDYLMSLSLCSLNHPCDSTVSFVPGTVLHSSDFLQVDVHREAIDDQCLILSVEELPPSSGDFARSASGSAAAGSEGVDNLSNSTGLCAWTAKLRFDNSESRELAMELLLSR